MKPGHYGCVLLFGLVFASTCRTVPAQLSRASRGAELHSGEEKFPYPTPEGKSGEKDASAMRELRSASAGSIPEAWKGIQASGVVSLGNRTERYSATMTAEHGNVFRLDYKTTDGTSSVRILGPKGGMEGPNGTSSSFELSRLSGPFPMLFRIWELAQDPDTSVVDDGLLTMGGREVRKITLGIKPIEAMTMHTVSTLEACYVYIDPNTHRIVNLVRTGHSQRDPSNSFVRVSTYDDYRAVETGVLPFAYSESEAGHKFLSFHAETISDAAVHEHSHYEF